MLMNVSLNLVLVKNILIRVITLALTYLSRTLDFGGCDESNVGCLLLVQNMI